MENKQNKDKYRPRYKRGFTLIELLAVIVILAIIALIATPIILNVIEESRDKANINSVHGLINAADLYYTKNIFDDTLSFDDKGQLDVLNDIKISGKKPEGGFLKLNKDGEVSVAAKYDDKCYAKDFLETIVTKVDISKCKGSGAGVQPDDSNNPSLPEVTCANKLKLGTASQSMIDAITNADNIVKNNNCAGTVDYRYNGPTVNNYVMFGGKRWRIIGLINGYVKIVSNDLFDDRYNWNDNQVNDWTTATLKDFLNNDYYNDMNGSEMIQEADYNIGGVSIEGDMDSITKLYNMENDDDVLPEKPTVIKNTKIVLMYPSDYGYSISSSCDQIPVMYGENENCNSNGTWMFKGENEFLLSPYWRGTGAASRLFPSGSLQSNGNVFVDHLKIRPAFYLKDSVEIIDGTGELMDPYIITMK